jgi:Spy/CpxP family protein refolding chaperone
MALEKVITYDYEVRGQFKHIQQRQRTAVMEDGKELSYSYHRRVLAPDADVSSESDEIKGMASALWTDAVKAAWAAKQAE